MTVAFARKLPAGGGERVRRAYLVMDLVFGLVFLAVAGLGLSLRGLVERGPELGTTFAVAETAAAIFALLMVAAAAAARSAVQDDTIRVRAMAPAAGLAAAGQLVALVGASGATLVGAVLAVTGSALTFLFSLCAGLVVLSLTIPGGILRRKIIATMYGTRG